MPRAGLTYRDSFWALLVLTAVIVWMPVSVNRESPEPARSRTTVQLGISPEPDRSRTTVQLGILRPLVAIWETWSEGTQFRIAEVRTLALLGSAALTFAAAYAARLTYVRVKQANEAEANA